MKYLNGTKRMHLTLSAESLRTIKWYVDASFAVHPGFRSHTGAVMTMGEGGMQVLTKKQKLNSRSLTEAELIGVDDAVTQIFWTNYSWRRKDTLLKRTLATKTITVLFYWRQMVAIGLEREATPSTFVISL